MAQTFHDTQQMLDDVATLVCIESPSRFVDGLTSSAHAIADLMTRVTGVAPEIIASDAGPMVHWRGGDDPHVLILGHHDTVHPVGTLDTFPFQVRGEKAFGPGIYDMKAGIVQAVHAVGSLTDATHVEMLFTADEEIGSRASRAFLEERARACGAVLVLEPSIDDGVLKNGRKGTGTFTVTVHGRSSHAGLEPEKGINSLVALADLIPQVVAIARPDIGTTVTPTMATAGTADNVVPARTTMTVDVRVVQPSEKDRVEREMSALTTSVADARVEVTGGIGRPPMHSSAAAELLRIAESVGADLDIAISAVEVGGGSDGNFTAAIGIHTLDGLGAVGHGSHTVEEHILIHQLAPRAALLAGIVQRLSSIDKMPPLPNVPADR